MLFNSFEFLVFYLAVLVMYFALADRYRWVLLLAASYWFYMSWKPEYVVLLLASTLINYGVGIALERAERATTRRALVTLGIVASLFLLFSFKYLDFFSQSLKGTLGVFSIDVDFPLFELLLPLGISFYTFQAVGYTIDVYRRSVPAEKHFGIFALYVSFFPQLVAGPIERSGNLLPQFRETKQFDAENTTAGMRALLWGLFKKIVIADQVGIVVDNVYASPMTYSGPYLVLATVFFAIQIYCDFSGYSDMAVGTARIMGFRLMTNFRRPYFSRSISEFWRRWHISLSTWFRDYVYLPLGGNRVPQLMWVRNILIVFLVSGVWHGANWTFVAWGGVHGLAMVASSLSADLRAGWVRLTRLDRVPRLHTVIQHAIVLVIVVVAWAFFRAQSVGDALSVIARMGDWDGANLGTLWRLGLPRFEMMVAFASIGVLFVVEWLQENEPGWVKAGWSRRPLRWTCYVAEIYAVALFGVFGRVEFIYFQF